MDTKKIYPLKIKSGNSSNFGAISLSLDNQLLALGTNGKYTAES